jgi:DNA-binding XRE family transcriptional regulator
MPLIHLMDAPGLLTSAQIALGLSQEELGKVLGCSRRTMVRWAGGHNGPSIQQWVQLVRRVHAVDPVLAARIAEEMGESLETFGLASASPPVTAGAAAPAAAPRAPMPIAVLVDSIVCAAAEAVATTPQAIRPALLAAFERTALAALTVDEVRAALRAASPPGHATRSAQNS